MHGRFTRDEVAATATADNRWHDLRISQRQCRRLGDVAILSYRADVLRADGQPYAALIGSTYARRADQWKLVFHQHSPVGDASDSRGGAEAEVRAVLEARAAAVGAKDAEASLHAYADHVAVFDLAPPLVQPASAARDPAQARAWFTTWDGPIRVTLDRLVIRVEGDLAFAFGLLHMSGRRVDGGAGDFWSRTTACLQRQGGQWRIVHEHNSFPMRMDGSGMAATDLHP